MNLIELIKRYEKQQAVKRRKALMAATRKLQGRFFKVFKLFRLKKYGEAYSGTGNSNVDNDLIDKMLPSEIKASLQQHDQMLKEIEQYLDKKDEHNTTLSDLHTVGEEDDDDDDEMNPSAFVHDQKEY